MILKTDGTTQSFSDLARQHRFIMPKLLQINVTANWGSTGKIAELIGREAMAQGWESHIAYGRYCNLSESKLIKIGNKLDTWIHFAGQRIFDNEGLWSKGATRRLIQRIEEIKPDIVHLHNIHDHYINYRLLFEFLNRSDIKVVWTMHDFWAITGHCMHFISKRCDQFETQCHDCPMRTVYPKSFIDRSKETYDLKKKLFSSNKNMSIVAVSDWVGNQFRRSFLKDKPLYVIPNGIDLSMFKPTSSESDLFEGKFVIMSVASQWRHDKGLEHYIALSKQLANDEVIVLVGVDKLLKEKLPPNIIGIEPVFDVLHLAALYTRADVVTIMSSAETFGLTVVEGYACGTPAVVFDNSAPPHLITHQTGYVVPDGNVDAAYHAIKNVRNKGKMSYSGACITLASNKYDKRISTRKYISLYESILQVN